MQKSLTRQGKSVNGIKRGKKKAQCGSPPEKVGRWDETKTEKRVVNDK